MDSHVIRLKDAHQNIGPQDMQGLFFVNKKPLEVVVDAVTSLVH